MVDFLDGPTVHDHMAGRVFEHIRYGVPQAEAAKTFTVLSPQHYSGDIPLDGLLNDSRSNFAGLQQLSLRPAPHLPGDGLHALQHLLCSVRFARNLRIYWKVSGDFYHVKNEQLASVLFHQPAGKANYFLVTLVAADCGQYGASCHGGLLQGAPYGGGG